MEFSVINPIIVGKFKTTYKGDTPLDAVKKFWHELSNIVINTVPQMGVTLKDEDGKLYHFKITEEIPSSKLVDFKIAPMKLTLPENIVRTIHDKYNEVSTKKSMKGGRKHRYDTDDDELSDEDDELIEKIDSKLKNATALKRHQPIIYYYYNPFIYQLAEVFMPVFTYPIAPYIEIKGFSTALWG